MADRGRDDGRPCRVKEKVHDDERGLVLKASKELEGGRNEG